MNLARIEVVQSYIDDFRFFLASQSGQEAVREIKERVELVRPLLSESHIKDITEEEFKTVMNTLRSLDLWPDKQSKIQSLLDSEGGVEGIRNGLRHLLYDRWIAADLYDEMGTVLSGFSSGVITEILALAFPDRYCFLDEPWIGILPFLRLDNLLPARLFRNEMTGADYLRYVEAMRLLKVELEISRLGGAGATDDGKSGFWIVSLFMDYVSDQVLKLKRFPREKSRMIMGSSSQAVSFNRAGFLWGLIQALVIGLFVVDGDIANASGFGVGIYPVVTFPFWWLLIPLGFLIGYRLADAEKTAKAILMSLVFTVLISIFLLTILPSPVSFYTAQGQLTFYGILSLLVLVAELLGSLPGTFLGMWRSERVRGMS